MALQNIGDGRVSEEDDRGLLSRLECADSPMCDSPRPYVRRVLRSPLASSADPEFGLRSHHISWQPTFDGKLTVSPASQ
jgi:hypothetical protein